MGSMGMPSSIGSMMVDTSIVKEAGEIQLKLESDYKSHFSTIETDVSDILDSIHSSSETLNNIIQSVWDVTSVIGGHEDTVGSAITQIKSFIKKVSNNG